MGNPEFPEFWEEVYDNIGFQAPGDPNEAISQALATKDQVAAILNDPNATYLVKQADGTIEERTRGEL